MALSLNCGANSSIEVSHTPFNNVNGYNFEQFKRTLCADRRKVLLDRSGEVVSDKHGVPHSVQSNALEEWGVQCKEWMDGDMIIPECSDSQSS
jgi:hypothetical protein